MSALAKARDCHNKNQYIYSMFIAYMHAKFFFTKLDHIAISLVISKVRVKTFTTQDHENPRPTCPTFFDNAYRKKNAQVLPERELPDRSCHLVKIWSYSHTVIHIYKLYIIYMYLQGKFQGPPIVGPLFPYYSKGLLRIYIYIHVSGQIIATSRDPHPKKR